MSWRFSWRADRLRQLHELGQAFGETEDSVPVLDDLADGDDDPPADAERETEGNP